MSKVRNLAEIAPNIGFTEFDFYDLYKSTFEKSELGRIKRLLPLREMAENFGLVSKSMRPKLGRKPFFTPEGKVALMFLKMYNGMSCPKLMEQLNGNIHYQMFCDVIIDPARPLTNYKLLDDIIMELAGKLKIQQQQDLLAEMWKPCMKNLDTMYTDATCYESEMRYPTDPKLLWEGIEKSYMIMCEFSSRLKLHRPRTKYLDVQKANLAYRKQRRRSKSQTRKMTRRLLDLLGKILKEIRRMEREVDGAGKLLTDREKGDLDVISKMYRQQKNHFRSKDCRESIKDRIVSINKPYVRPIVRGKEVKSAEFGAKGNNILVDGISFIEKLSFSAFNEGTRLVHCLKMHKRLFGVEAKKVGGDTGYAGTENRDYCKENGIQTSFVKRARPFSEEKQEKDNVRQELARVRATAMEGSFGTQKEHYDLMRIKARTKLTEILYIFFGIHTANVVQLAKRIEQRTLLEVA
ncbi:MAG: transposase [Bacteroidales bacterium]|nr:transposase [Bacteroidales bacterium]MDY6001416.1 transposase [Candidatus Cryptobacteroides sp.]